MFRAATFRMNNDSSPGWLRPKGMGKFHQLLSDFQLNNFKIDSITLSIKKKGRESNYFTYFCNFFSVALFSHWFNQAGKEVERETRFQVQAFDSWNWYKEILLNINLWRHTNNFFHKILNNHFFWKSLSL